MQRQGREPVAIAITGASGAQYGLRLIEVLLKQDVPVYLMVSKAAHIVISTETDIKLPAQAAQMQQFLCDHFSCDENLLRVFGKEDWMSPLASGSGAPSRMVVCPCSTGTLSAIACGASNNLIERAADVALKERRKLILVPRETPYSQIHLEHMLKLTQMGAVILPASPGFYHEPAAISDLIDFIVARILSQLGIEQDLLKKWGDE